VSDQSNWIQDVLDHASMCVRLDDNKFAVLWALEKLVDESTVCESDFDDAKRLIKLIRTGES